MKVMRRVRFNGDVDPQVDSIGEFVVFLSTFADEREAMSNEPTNESTEHRDEHIHSNRIHDEQIAELRRVNFWLTKALIVLAPFNVGYLIGKMVAPL